MAAKRIWRAEFDASRRGNNIPYVRWICSEKVMGAKYSGSAKGRPGDKHILFKYTLTGKGAFRINGNIYELPQGYAFICQIGHPGYEYFYPEDSDEPWEYVYMSFSYNLDVMNGIFSKYGQVYDLGKDSAIIQKICSYKSKNMYQMIPCHESFTLISELLASLIRSKESENKVSPGRKIVSSAMEIIFKDLPRDIRLTDISRQLDISCEHLCRVFKKETGNTLQNFILRQRIFHACDLIRNAQLSLKEIAFKMGYDTQSHFSRAFKKILGITPGEYKTSSSSQFY